MDPGLLFIPGPVPLPPEVREELAKAALPHYGDAWVKAHSETHDLLRYLWSAPDAHVFPIAGPGHAALEAIAYTFLRPGDRVVVVSNGFFGERTHEVLMSHRLKAEVVASPWGAAPGLAPVAVSPALWESADPTTVEGWYLNLFTWDRYEREWGDWHPTPTTISSNLFYAFHRALTLLRKEGLEARIVRHAKVAAKLRAGLIDLGFTAVGPPAHLSNTVACLTPPTGVDPMRLVRRLKEEHNIYISGGLGPLRGKTIRIGTMGTQADLETIDWLLKEMRASL